MEVGPCAAQTGGGEKLSGKLFFLVSFRKKFILRDNRSWPGEFKEALDIVSIGGGRQKYMAAKRGMTAILLSSRLHFAKNKMASESLCCPPPTAQHYLILLFIHSEGCGLVGE